MSIRRLVARIRTDISIADFEIGLRDYVSNVENAYWDLYYAYRDLDATSANGIAFGRDNLCFPTAGGSFEEGMGA